MVDRPSLDMVSRLSISMAVETDVFKSFLIFAHASHVLPMTRLTNLPMQSQLDPLPGDLPFRIISKTIGRGAYASYVLAYD